MDGIEVLKEIRKEIRDRIIILSARSEVEDKVPGLDLAPTIGWPKPFTSGN